MRSLMNWFEKTFQSEPPIEKDHERENGRIELTDQEIVERLFIAPANHQPLKEAKVDEKGKSKSPARKPKKANPKPDKTPVARLQKKL